MLRIDLIGFENDTSFLSLWEYVTLMETRKRGLVRWGFVHACMFKKKSTLTTV